MCGREGGTEMMASVGERKGDSERGRERSDGSIDLLLHSYAQRDHVL